MRDQQGRATAWSFFLVAGVPAGVVLLLRYYGVTGPQLPHIDWEDGILSVLTLFVGALMRLVCVDLEDIPAVPEPNPSPDELPRPHVEACYRAGIQGVVNREEAWREARARNTKLPHTRTPQLGLCLSGGGIRAATFSLGVAQALGESSGGKATWLQLVDYISSVSGGGWLAAALTARVGRTSAEKVWPPADPTWWRRLARQLRAAGDYVAPGGFGFSGGIFGPAIAIIWGALINALAVFFLLFSFCVTLGGGRHDDHMLFRLVRAGEACPLINPLYIHTWSIHTHLWGFNLFPLLLSLSIMVLGGCLVGVVGGIIAGRDDLHRGSTTVGSYAVMVGSVTGFITLALGGSRVVTWLLVALLLVIIVASAVPRLSSKQLGAVLGLVTVSGIASAFGKLNQYAPNVTRMWHDALLTSLSWPASYVDRVNRPREYVAGFTLLLFFLFGMLITRNAAGMHAYWRRQIRRAYQREGDTLLDPELALSGATQVTEGIHCAACSGTDAERHEKTVEGELKANERRRGTRKVSRDGSDHLRPAADQQVIAPLHIINAAINVPGSDVARLRARRTARFEFSPVAIGGPATGWVCASRYREIELSEAAAISAAAMNSQGGDSIPALIRPLITALNLGLGVWLLHPQVVANKGRTHDIRNRLWPHFWTWASLREVMGVNDEREHLVLVSDGGHHDNLGLSALVERNCRTIICIDAAADPHYDLGDLARVARILEVDHEWRLEGIESPAIRPKDPAGTPQERVSSSPVTIGKLTRRDDTLTVIYVKAALVPEIPLQVEEYARRNPTFPQTTTADQFFDEA
ncbi:MAG: patatin-like phospholipase family protein, partial [Myxococcales bacterium]|nr:patatin-like phospholipase family protein [Myxococcales bacterium]